jgi:hypothetical protein
LMARTVSRTSPSSIPASSTCSSSVSSPVMAYSDRYRGFLAVRCNEVEARDIPRSTQPVRHAVNSGTVSRR